MSRRRGKPGDDRREPEDVALQEMLDALTPGCSAGRLVRKRMFRMLDEEVAPAAVDVFIWDMECTGELDPFLV